MDSGKYFYIYLLTNSYTKQCGIHELSKIMMIVETGLGENIVDCLIKKSVDEGNSGHIATTFHRSKGLGFV
jgi:hypothetical protein